MIAKTLASLASKLFAGLAGVGMALALQLSHAVPLLNAGFESGNLAGWNIGSGPFPGTDAGWGVVPGLAIPPAVPTQDGFMAMVSNAGQVRPGTPLINHGLPFGVVNGDGGTLISPVPVPGSNPFPPPLDVTHLCSLIGCFAVQVAELWQTFSVDGASTLRFDWNFLTNEQTGSLVAPSFIDSAFVSIFGPSGQLVQFLAQNFGSAFAGAAIGPLAQAAGQYGFQTGWHHSDFALSEPGVYTFVLGVSNGGDTLGSSALLIDNIQVVPEPAILALLGLGLAGLGISGRRSKKS